MSRRKKTTEQFIAEARAVHGDKYDYSKVQYVRRDVKVTIICKHHGPFEQQPSSHLKGRGCSRCWGNHKFTTEEFKAKAKEIHGDKYDYSKVQYVGSKTKVTIICPEHGPFEQQPRQHVNLAHGCPQCTGYIGQRTTEEFKAKAKEVHGDKYDYSKVEYVNSKTKVTIICPDHGEFEQAPDHHFNNGRGCPQCANGLVSEPIFRKVLEEITSLKFPKNKPKWLKNPDTSYPLELDCYNQESKIAFELQGIHHYSPVEHWGGEEAFQKVLERDQIKKTTCEEKGIHLFCIDQRPATGKTPQEKEEYYKKEIKKCLQQLPQHVKIKMNRR